LASAKGKEGKEAGVPDAHPISALETRPSAVTDGGTQAVTHERKRGNLE
jgi:hypothetical protein